MSAVWGEGPCSGCSCGCDKDNEDRRLRQALSALLCTFRLRRFRNALALVASSAAFRVCLARSCLSVHQDRTDNQATTDCDPHNPPFSIVLVENNDNNVAVQYSTRRSF
jgi:hypothetical protein